MGLEELRQAFIALIQKNGITSIVVVVIVVHGFTTKLLAWLNKKGKNFFRGVIVDYSMFVPFICFVLSLFVCCIVLK